MDANDNDNSDQKKKKKRDQGSKVQWKSVDLFALNVSYQTWAKLQNMKINCSTRGIIMIAVYLLAKSGVKKAVVSSYKIHGQLKRELF